MENEPGKLALREMARKKALVDSQKCISRSKELVKGSRVLIDNHRRQREKKESH